MGKRVDLMNTAMMPAVLTGNKEALQAVQEMDEEVDVLYKHLVNYLAEVSKLQLNEYQTQKIMKRIAPDLDIVVCYFRFIRVSIIYLLKSHHVCA
jgi:phosphate uptake regulator